MIKKIEILQISKSASDIEIKVNTLYKVDDNKDIVVNKYTIRLQSIIKLF